MPLDTRREGNSVFVKLADGEDLFPSLEKAAREQGFEDGSVLWGIGMIQDFEIGFFGPEGYAKTVFSDRCELLGLHGSVSLRGDPKIHLHVTVGRPDHAALGGHLFRAKAAVVNEIHLVGFDGIRFSRRLNEKTGLRELIFE
jgi:uncharacterized protein